jgi:hypothetical protein
MTALWYIAPCSIVEVDRRFRGAYCLRRQGDESRRNIPEGCLHTRRRENLKSHKKFIGSTSVRVDAQYKI